MGEALYFADLGNSSRQQAGKIPGHSGDNLEEWRIVWETRPAIPASHTNIDASGHVGLCPVTSSLF